MNHQATTILRRLAAGEEAAAGELLPLVYDELRQLAEGCMRRERANHTLQPTALVHEVYARLADAPDLTFKDRSHFLGVAARAMRQVLVDHARHHGARKRGGDWGQVTLGDPSNDADEASVFELLALDDALELLAQKDERLARTVELRFFGGLTIRETAAALDVSHTTIENDWTLARAWLARELSGDTR